MPRNQHPEDPAEGSRETVDRELKRSEANEAAGSKAKAAGGSGVEADAPAVSAPSHRRPTQEQVHADIDAGKHGDKTPGFDPAAAPMEADAEAGGFSTEASDHAVQIEDPKPQNAASTANAMRPTKEDEGREGDTG
jgi:hypothetical protein